MDVYVGKGRQLRASLKDEETKNDLKNSSTLRSTQLSTSCPRSQGELGIRGV